MWRLLVLVLLGVNGGLALWFWLQADSAGQGREPQRLAHQIQADKLQAQAVLALVGSAPASAPMAVAVTMAPASTPARNCWRVGPLDTESSKRLQDELTQQLASNYWQLQAQQLAPSWLVYMGRYADVETLERKKGELRFRRLEFQLPDNPALRPGLALSRHDSESSAAQALAELSHKGIRTARVVQEWPARQQWWLQVQAEAALAARPALQAILGKQPLLPCLPANAQSPSPQTNPTENR